MAIGSIEVIFYGYSEIWGPTVVLVPTQFGVEPISTAKAQSFTKEGSLKLKSISARVI